MKQRYFLETDRDSLLFNLVFCDEDPVLAGNIKRSGIDMSKADALVISHLHPDHIGGFNAFKQNRIPLPEGCRQLRAYPGAGHAGPGERKGDCGHHRVWPSHHKDDT